MYAIVEMKGQQFKVEAGKKLFINRIADLEKGATVEFENVVFHKKRRKGYRKLNGHRQDLTNVVVKEIVIA